MPKNEKRQTAGQYLDIKIFPAKKPPRVRGQKRNPTRQAQVWLNAKKSEEELEKIINQNFTKKDFWVHPTYAENFMPESEEQALKDLNNYIRRIKRLYKSRGLECKIVKKFEWSDKGRPHFHICMSGGVEPLEIIEKWGMGMVGVEHFQFSERGAKGIARYMTKTLHGKCRWSCSRNCEKPPAAKERFITNKTFNTMWNDFESRQLWEERYKDYFFVSAEKTDNSEYFRGEQYIHVRMCRRDADLSFVGDQLYASSAGKLTKRRGRPAAKLKAPPGQKKC